jgi:signal transduction histidine kinase
MHKLIRDLLDLTQIESGRKNRSLTKVDVAEIARTALETVQAAAASRQIAVQIHAHDDVSMQADAREIEMLLNNMLSNAVKYNRDGGTVDVTIDRKDGQILIAVADTGIGMTPEETGQIFHEFVRIKNERTQNILGSGLGLSLVKKIVQLYDGVVDVDSRPNVGTTFTISLNAAKPTSVSAAQSPIG